MPEFSVVAGDYGPSARETPRENVLSTACRTLIGVPSAPAEARRFTRERLAGHPRLDDILLVVSELVTNAVRHSASRDGGAVTVTLIARPGGTRIEVRDEGSPGAGPSIAPPRPAWDLPETGRGLALVAELSQGRWGHHPHRDGRNVWAELAV